MSLLLLVPTVVSAATVVVTKAVDVWWFSVVAIASVVSVSVLLLVP